MRKFLNPALLLVFFALTADVAAQNEFLNKNNSIAPLGKPSTGMMSGSSSTNSVYTPNVFKTEKKSSSSSSTIPEKKVDMTLPEFANTGSNYEKHLNDKLKKEEVGISRDRQFYRNDANLGKFMTLSKTVTISYRDYGEVDQDFIKILHNGEVVREMVFLQYNYNSVTINLKKGSNTIEFLALNTGISFPNTAEFMVKDELGNIITSNMWALDEGFKAIITIEKN